VRILDVSPRVTFPPVRGSSVRTYNLLRHLSGHHDIRQFSQARGRGKPAADRASTNPSYCEVQHGTLLTALIGERAERSWVRAPLLSGAALRTSRPALLDGLLSWADVVLVEFPWQLAHCRRRRPGACIVLDSHNVEATKFESYAQAAGIGLQRRCWLSLVQRMERRGVADADLVLTVSDADRESMINTYRPDPARVVVIPNGADTQDYVPVSGRVREAAKRELGLPCSATVLFAGADVPPNRAGLQWVRRVAAQAPQFTFLVVGPVCRPGVRGNVIATGLVDDFSRYLAAADFSICPIEHGGGTKIKLLESLAAGLPTVVFAEALDGLPLRDGEHVLVAAKRERALLRALQRLQEDSDFAARMARAARRVMENEYSWRVVADRLDRALERLVHERSLRQRRLTTGPRRTPPARVVRAGAAPARPPTSRGDPG
jgi:glycosyltransferase involved in cell wall biosynthesis